MSNVLECYLPLQFDDEAAADEAVKSLKEDPNTRIAFDEIEQKGSQLTLTISLEAEYVAEKVEPDIMNDLEDPIRELGGNIDEGGIYFR